MMLDPHREYLYATLQYLRVKHADDELDAFFRTFVDAPADDNVPIVIWPRDAVVRPPNIARWHPAREVMDRAMAEHRHFASAVFYDGASVPHATRACGMQRIRKDLGEIIKNHTGMASGPRRLESLWITVRGLPDDIMPASELLALIEEFVGNPALRNTTVVWDGPGGIYDGTTLHMFPIAARDGAIESIGEAPHTMPAGFTLARLAPLFALYCEALAWPHRAHPGAGAAPGTIRSTIGSGTKYLAGVLRHAALLHQQVALYTHDAYQLWPLIAQIVRLRWLFDSDPDMPADTVHTPLIRPFFHLMGGYAYAFDVLQYMAAVRHAFPVNAANDAVLVHLYHVAEWERIRAQCSIVPAIVSLWAMERTWRTGQHETAVFAFDSPDMYVGIAGDTTYPQDMREHYERFFTGLTNNDAAAWEPLCFSMADGTPISVAPGADFVQKDLAPAADVFLQRAKWLADPTDADTCLALCHPLASIAHGAVPAAGIVALVRDCHALGNRWPTWSEATYADSVATPSMHRVNSWFTCTTPAAAALTLAATHPKGSPFVWNSFVNTSFAPTWQRWFARVAAHKLLPENVSPLVAGTWSTDAGSRELPGLADAQVAALGTYKYLNSRMLLGTLLARHLTDQRLDVATAIPCASAINTPEARTVFEQLATVVRSQELGNATTAYAQGIVEGSPSHVDRFVQPLKQLASSDGMMATAADVEHAMHIARANFDWSGVKPDIRVALRLPLYPTCLFPELFDLRSRNPVYWPIAVARVASIPSNPGPVLSAIHVGECTISAYGGTSIWSGTTFSVQDVYISDPIADQCFQVTCAVEPASNTGTMDPEVVESVYCEHRASNAASQDQVSDNEWQHWLYFYLRIVPPALREHINAYMKYVSPTMNVSWGAQLHRDSNVPPGRVLASLSLRLKLAHCPSSMPAMPRLATIGGGDIRWRIWVRGPVEENRLPVEFGVLDERRADGFVAVQGDPKKITAEGMQVFVGWLAREQTEMNQNTTFAEMFYWQRRRRQPF